MWCSSVTELSSILIEGAALFEVDEVYRGTVSLEQLSSLGQHAGNPCVKNLLDLNWVTLNVF